jgi:hypothetical protein
MFHFELCPLLTIFMKSKSGDLVETLPSTMPYHRTTHMIRIIYTLMGRGHGYEKVPTNVVMVSIYPKQI